MYACVYICMCVSVCLILRGSDVCVCVCVNASVCRRLSVNV